MSGPWAYDSVYETTTTTGTGTITLAGAVTGFLSFSVVGNGNTCYYRIEHQTPGEWEVGLGTYTSSGTTLARTTVLASSNSGSAVNFSSGTKNVYLVNPAVAIQRGLVILQEQQTQNTNGGTFTSGAWRTRTLNTEVIDTANLCSLSSNQFTLTAGTYDILVFAPAYNCGRHQLRLYNTTDSSVVVLGGTQACAQPAGIEAHAQIMDRFTIGASKALEIQHQCETTQATYGFGVAGNFTTEIFTQVRLLRVG